MQAKLWARRWEILVFLPGLLPLAVWLLLNRSTFQSLGFFIWQMCILMSSAYLTKLLIVGRCVITIWKLEIVQMDKVSLSLPSKTANRQAGQTFRCCTPVALYNLIGWACFWCVFWLVECMFWLTRCIFLLAGHIFCLAEHISSLAWRDWLDMFLFGPCHPIRVVKYFQ